jgi:hypothetical protein
MHRSDYSFDEPERSSASAYSRSAVFLFLLSLAVLSACNSQPSTRILIIGNSYTFFNGGLEKQLAGLAPSAEVASIAIAGYSLENHWKAGKALKEIRSGTWNFVVLQEQSQLPSVEQFRQTQMYPAARRLIGAIRNQGARPLFYLTWARRDGWPENGMPDYASMQAAINQGYVAIAAEQHVAVAPVGVAWSQLVAGNTPVELWQQDGSHPTEAGTYLAACVFYATIFRESPKGLSYHSSLSADEAAMIQAAATETVLGDAAMWPPPTE